MILPDQELIAIFKSYYLNAKSIDEAILLTSKEIYNNAIEDAAKSAEVDGYEFDNGNMIVDKNSILKLKVK
jgi:hypothetical protein